ncbi:pyrrolidone-carboxylate peptidase [Streptomyces sp. NBRC 110611]|uniref:pyroglutamyl-peptidase I n=1 Tax=Streptomyces sp. NBRC 110611 TaxID=1621259 RepID=UPI00082ED205|nr:pyroglutamyl-peptidase I [Streptomyces sp. NBRC 110611]GAU64764.1 pyrrolidone-carboxylate peptidase [Streptomyces sp. NBRC 110611]
MTRVLITGFEPFGGMSDNPTWLVAQLLRDDPPPGLEVHCALLPCSYAKSELKLREAVAESDPELVVCLGLAAGRSGISIERTAINVDDCPVADNDGRTPVDEPIVADGPAAYFSRLPIKRCAAAIREAGIPAGISESAGAFVCNHVFYTLMYLLATEHPQMRGGFVHIPAAPHQALNANCPSMPVETTARGLRTLLATAAAHDTDIKAAEGATS